MSQPVSYAEVRLRLSQAQAEALRGFARAAAPGECCGLVMGEGAADVTVAALIPAPNVAESPADAFAIDPQLHFDTLRAARATARRIVGHYHSHPNGRATPSERDLAMAYDPEAIWVIVAMREGQAAQIRAFQRPVDHDGFIEIPITILP